jgi:hypothetical protein
MSSVPSAPAREATVRADPRAELAPTVGQVLGSLAILSGLVLTLPLVILGIGAPIALAVRALLEAVRWIL